MKTDSAPLTSLHRDSLEGLLLDQKVVRSICLGLQLQVGLKEERVRVVIIAEAIVIIAVINIDPVKVESASMH